LSVLFVFFMDEPVEDGVNLEKKWKVAENDEALRADLAQALAISPLAAGLLLHRGIDDAAEARRFLYPETEQQFYEPFLMQDMELAVARVVTALDRKERIIVYGDYDVDGITATAVLVRCLRRLGADAGYYIPNRLTEGYGIKTEALQQIADEGASLLISVDCGISAVDELAAIEQTLDVIITDHHLPGPVLPHAVAIVNPHRDDCRYPYAELAGVGVAFKLCQAVWQRLKQEEYTADLELVALGTIADIVPLLDENRKLVKIGLERMQHTAIVGLQALLEAAGLTGKTVTAGQVGFVLAPRLNAAGRVAAATQGAELFLMDDPVKAIAVAAELNDENSRRQELERAILAQAEKQLERVDTAAARVLVLAGEDWHPGVIGIVASRLVDKYYRPTVVIGIKDGVGKGSCRSIKGFHMYEALSACSDILLGFGGHAMAAGLSVAADQIDALRDALTAFAETHLSAQNYIPVLEIEAELSPAEVDSSFMEELARLEPYGMGNPQPLFCCLGVQGRNAGAMGRDKQHLKFEVVAGRRSIRAFSWNRSEYAPFISQGAMDMVYVPVVNEWNGNRSIECKVLELRGSAQEQVFPNRSILGGIYRMLRQWQTSRGSIPLDESLLALPCGISAYTLQQGLHVFGELGLLQRTEDHYQLLPPPGEKLDLMDSTLYRQAMSGRDRNS
jgi:single-stranded-DNA-specific exonuclease